MKEYIKPELNDEEVSLEDIIAKSGLEVQDVGDVSGLEPDGDLGDF